MARIYAKRCEAGEMLWTDIPSLWKKKACAEIEKDGYILNEDGTVSLPEPILVSGNDMEPEAEVNEE